MRLYRGIAALEAAPRGSVATVPAYAQHGSSPWFWGDDLRLSSLRDRVATLGFGLRGIEISPPYRTLEAVPPLRNQVPTTARSVSPKPTARPAVMTSTSVSENDGSSRPRPRRQAS